MKILAELKHRNVIRMGSLHMVGAWLVRLRDPAPRGRNERLRF